MFFTDAYIGCCVLQWSMSVSKGKSDKATSCTKNVRSTDLPFNPLLLFNVSVVGTCAHHRPRLARPLMSLIPSLLLVPQFRGVYISTQLINFSIAVPHLQCFTFIVVSRFWSKRLRSFTMFCYTNPFSVTHLSRSGTLSAPPKRTQSRGPCSLPVPR